MLFEAYVAGRREGRARYQRMASVAPLASRSKAGPTGALRPTHYDSAIICCVVDVMGDLGVILSRGWQPVVTQQLLWVTCLV